MNDTSFDCCWFDYVTSATLFLRAARQLQSPTTYVARLHLPTTTTWRDYKPTTSYYDAVIRPLLLLLHGLQGATSIYDYTSTTNYYYAENQSTTSLLLRLTTCRVHKLLLYGVPPVHFVRLQTMMIYLQLTYQRSLLLQLYRTVNWHCVSLLLFHSGDDVEQLFLLQWWWFPVIVSVLMMSWQSSTVIPIVWRCASLMKVPDVGYFFCRSRLW